jgi:hypothetical protein
MTRPGEAATAADTGLANMALASALALVCLVAAVLVHTAIRFAHRWVQRRRRTP